MFPRYGPTMLVRCGNCQQPAPVVEVNDRGRLYFALDCQSCGLHIPHAPVAGDVESAAPSGPGTETDVRTSGVGNGDATR